MSNEAPDSHPQIEDADPFLDVVVEDPIEADADSPKSDDVSPDSGPLVPASLPDLFLDLLSPSDDADYIPSSMDEDSDTYPSSSVTRGAKGIFKTNPRYTLTVAAYSVPIPKSLRWALKSSEWKNAMLWKFEALQNNI